MKFYIRHQESYSRGELLLRSFFGIFYISLPHGIVQAILSIGLMFINIFRFWIILFTGKWPKGMFDYAVKMQRYAIRVQARTMNLADGYPAFGLSGTDTQSDFDIAHQESYSRGRLIVRALFGIFMIIPHVFVLLFRMIGVIFIQMIIWWVILITGKYPKGMFDFVVGTLRLQLRVNAFLYFLTDNYPSFSGDIAEGEQGDDGAKASNPDLLDDTL
jgi:hypothetical protein